ncbi:MAG: sterol homeostasis protein [Trizodia sp. TS-e1964]|nr:MAG: sterol homeostasis protein [Trizodia sp. TS-e1964]
MPICIECRTPVKELYQTYHAADDGRLGAGIRLIQCPACKRFADKYVEHDFVVLFIDLVLIKPQVYRHLLFNRLGHERDAFDPSIVRLGVLLLLFDVYLTWARIEKHPPPAPAGIGAPHAEIHGASAVEAMGAITARGNFGRLASQPIIAQYLFFLFLCLAESLAFHFTIRLLVKVLRPNHPYRPNAVSTALLVSSCTKLFPILMVIWDYDVPAAAKSVGWAVVVNNVEALKILLDCGYAVAAFLAGVGALVRLAVGWAILRTMGLEGGGGGEAIGDLRGLWLRVSELASKAGIV